MAGAERKERTRADDLRPPRWWERAWRRWLRVKDPIFAVAGITGFFGCIVLAILVYDASQQRAEDQRVVRVIVEEQAKYARAQAENARATARSARLTCTRTRTFAPYLIADYEARGVFPQKVIDEYKRTLPRTCPK